MQHLISLLIALDAGLPVKIGSFTYVVQGDELYVQGERLDLFGGSETVGLNAGYQLHKLIKLAETMTDNERTVMQANYALNSKANRGILK